MAFTQARGEPWKDPTPTSSPRTPLGSADWGPPRAPAAPPIPYFGQAGPAPDSKGGTCYLRGEGRVRGVPSAGRPVALSAGRGPKVGLKWAQILSGEKAQVLGIYS